MRCIHYNQTLGHLRIASGKGPGEYSSPVMPNQNGLLLSSCLSVARRASVVGKTDRCRLPVQSFDQSFNVFDKCRYVIACAWFIRVIVPTQIRGNNGIAMLSQERNLVSPRIPELREAMQEHDQGTLTLGHIVHANAIGDDIEVPPCFCCSC